MTHTHKPFQDKRTRWRFYFSQTIECIAHTKICYVKLSLELDEVCDQRIIEAPSIHNGKKIAYKKYSVCGRLL
jgi:hypothetical protein